MFSSLCMSTGEKDESVSKTYITQVKDLRLQIEDVESRTIARMRQPVDKDPLKDCFRKTAEQTVPLLYIYILYCVLYFSKAMQEQVLDALNSIREFDGKPGPSSGGLLVLNGRFMVPDVILPRAE